MWYGQARTAAANFSKHFNWGREGGKKIAFGLHQIHQIDNILTTLWRYRGLKACYTQIRTVHNFGLKHLKSAALSKTFSSWNKSYRQHSTSQFEKLEIQHNTKQHSMETLQKNACISTSLSHSWTSYLPRTRGKRQFDKKYIYLSIEKKRQSSLKIHHSGGVLTELEGSTHRRRLALL